MKFKALNEYFEYDAGPMAFTAKLIGGDWTDLYFLIAEGERPDGSMSYMARRIVNSDGVETIVEQENIDFSELRR